MPKPDLILLHAPSIYDFRENITLYGPISDGVPSTPIFELFPIGFISIAEYLERSGFHVRIVNLAVKMLKDPAFNVERLIEQLDPTAFGIDLHWLVHSHGSLEVAKIVKKYHPNTPTILGGLSSTYFHREIMANFPYVDYVVRGDSTEEPLRRLLQCIEQQKTPNEVPNLTWRDETGKTRINPLTWVPETLDDVATDYANIINLVKRHRDVTGNLPFENWLNYPITALLTCKGCIYNCVICGGSCSAYKKFYNRSRPAFKSPEKLVDEMKTIEQYVKAPIFLLNDIRLGGKNHAEQILRAIKAEDVDNPVIFELFDAASSEFIELVSNSCSSYSLEISPESHDEVVRGLHGRPFTNRGLEKTIQSALKYNCQKLDVFFIIGLPRQTPQSVIDSVEYGRTLLEKYGKDGRLHPFILPNTPFLDPGSLAFEHPERYGYERFFTSLSEHREALTNPSWSHFLNYQTKWMKRSEIVEVTYKSLHLLNEIKREYRLIDPIRAEKFAESIQLADTVTRLIDQIVTSTSDKEKRRIQLQRLKEEVDAINRSSTYLKEGLEFPFEAKIKKIAIIKSLMGKF